jgi:hypothetical protein
MAVATCSCSERIDDFSNNLTSQTIVMVLMIHFVACGDTAVFSSWFVLCFDDQVIENIDRRIIASMAVR